MKHAIAMYLALIALGTAQAQDAGDIAIGVTLPLSGTNAGSGQEGLAVMNAYFESVNRSGGIGGRKLVLKTLDDEFDPRKAADNTRKLVQSKVAVIFNCWGTSSCNAMVPIATEAGVPMVAGIAGGGLMRQAHHKYVFNVRATTAQEVARMVNQMITIGQRTIAVVYQNDPFGQSGQAAALEVFSKAGLQPAALIAIERDASNATSVVDRLRNVAGLNGVILIAAPPATVKLIPAARKAGVAAQFYNLAAQANQKVAIDLGEHTNGVVFTSLVPSPWKEALPVVKEYQQIYSTATGISEFSYLGLEVFINAKVLVEGLRKAGRGVGRENIASALESVGAQRYGPMGIHYTMDNHEGSNYVGLTMINRQGRFVE